MRELRWIAGCVLVLGLVTWGRSCDDNGDVVTAAADRVVSLETTACGDASKTTGAGVVVSPGRVLAAAHVVIGAAEVTVELPGGARRLADVVVLDPRADLALLAIADADASPIVVAPVSVGDSVSIAGGGPSGAFDATVLRRLEIRTQAVRSTESISRFGFEIDRRVELGDSGAGAYDDADRLVGMVFGRSQNRQDASFVVGKQHIDEVLTEATDESFVCNPDQSRLIAAGPP